MSRGRLQAAKVLPRPCLDVLMPRLGLNVMTSKLRYDIIIYNFNLVSFCTFQIFAEHFHTFFGHAKSGRVIYQSQMTTCNRKWIWNNV